MTTLPAKRLGWTDRGAIQQGYWADVVVFDPKTVIDKATFFKPHQYSVGVEHMIIRGRFVLKSGKMTGQRPGRPILSVPVARTPRTKLRRDLLTLLQSIDGRFALHVKLPGNKGEFTINGDDPFSVQGLTKRPLSKPRLSVSQLAEELIRRKSADFQKFVAATTPNGHGRILMFQRISSDEKTITVVTLVFDKLSKKDLPKLSKQIQKRLLRRLRKFNTVLNAAEPRSRS